MTRESSIALRFEELTEPLDRWRGPTVEVAGLGVPPHITLLYPWRQAPLQASDIAELEQLLQSFDPFSLCFDRVETFESGVVFLALADERPTRALMKAIFNAFPDTPPYGGEFADPSPHLTVAKCRPEALDQLKDEVSDAFVLPRTFHIQEVVVMEEQTDGQWLNRHVLRL